MAQMPAEGAQPLAIVVVDGNPVTRNALVALVEDAGHAAICAADADEAWARLRERPADVLLADWPEPGAPGGPAIDLLLRARDRERIDGAPFMAVVLVGPPSSRATVPAALLAGADGFLARPVDRADLAACLIAMGRLVTLRRRLLAAESHIAQQAEQLREELRRDPLTRLGNRMRLDEDLRRFRARAQRYGHRATAIILGVDQLRRYNDALGRAAGDEALRTVARAVTGCLRDGDAAYRYTGDQLLVLLPEQREEAGVIVAERCRTAVAALAIPHPRSDAGPVVTLSAGVAELHGSGADAIDDWLRRAGQALDAALASGRNAVARGDNTRVAGAEAGA